MNTLTIYIEKSCYIIIDNINKHYFDNNIYIDNKLHNLSYCITIWGNTYTSNIKIRIIILQNRAIGAIYNLQNRINSDEFYNSLNILKFKDIYKCKTILIMYDVLNSKSTYPYTSLFFLKKITIVKEVNINL